MAIDTHKDKIPTNLISSNYKTPKLLSCYGNTKPCKGYCLEEDENACLKASTEYVHNKYREDDLTPAFNGRLEEITEEWREEDHR